MNGTFALIRKEKKYLLAASVFLLVMFVLAMVQNVIRYGMHATYNPWRSGLYLIISILLFVPFLPLALQAFVRALNRYHTLYWLVAVFISFFTILVFYFSSSVIIHVLGFFDHYFTVNYARQYFGRGALFHLLVLAGTALYVYYRYKNRQQKMISAMLGKKEMTISADLIRWIEADDHYLKIYAQGPTLIKRYTLEKMAEELKPDFIRIHRKYLVNKNMIRGKERRRRDEFVILQSGERLKVGRSFGPVPIS